jgi:hypothetical protein
VDSYNPVFFKTKIHGIYRLPNKNTYIIFGAVYPTVTLPNKTDVGPSWNFGSNRAQKGPGASHSCNILTTVSSNFFFSTFITELIGHCHIYIYPPPCLQALLASVALLSDLKNRIWAIFLFILFYESLFRDFSASFIAVTRSYPELLGDGEFTDSCIYLPIRLRSPKKSQNTHRWPR